MLTRDESKCFIGTKGLANQKCMGILDVYTCVLNLFPAAVTEDQRLSKI